MVWCCCLLHHHTGKGPPSLRAGEGRVVRQVDAVRAHAPDLWHPHAVAQLRAQRASYDREDPHTLLLVQEAVGTPLVVCL